MQQKINKVFALNARHIKRLTGVLSSWAFMFYGTSFERFIPKKAVKAIQKIDEMKEFDQLKHDIAMHKFTDDNIRAELGQKLLDLEAQAEKDIADAKFWADETYWGPPTDPSVAVMHKLKINQAKLKQFWLLVVRVENL